jgi:hypothetical protein
MRLKKFLLTAALGGLALLGANSARGNSIVITPSDAAGTPVGNVNFPNTYTPVNLGNGTYEYYYRVAITPQNTLQTGDFFSILDFSGLVLSPAPTFAPSPFTLTGATAANFAFSTVTPPILLDSGTAFNESLKDNPTVLNVTFTYTGATTLNSANATMAQFDSTGTLVVLGVITARSTLFTPRVDGYIGQDHTTTSIASTSQNGADTLVPGLANGTEAPLPTAAWGGMALIGLLGGTRLRRAKQA